MPQQQPEMEAVSSGNIASWGYNSEASELWVTFNSGGTYVYSSVPSDVAQGMREAPSKGEYHAAYVKKSYPYERVA